MIRKKQSSYLTLTIINVPIELLNKIGNIHIHIDVIFINGNLFIYSISDKINLRIVDYIKYRTKSNILSIIEKIIKLYYNNV